MSGYQRARAVMVLGTTSGAGKSWLATALCRWYARQGLKVAPFKAQNMSNNARVVPGLDGQAGEIGSAQYFQALAARVSPDVRMNPILLKPEHDMGCQVVVMGQVRPAYNTMPWRERSEVLWPHARHALHELMADHDLVLIEGAGSPAEINLHHCDYVNMRTALQAHASCLLVSDIDRGGSFAHLFGTHQLLPPDERALIKGFVLNRFRGDPSLLSPGPERLQRLTGVPTVGVVPMWPGHGLPEEDGLHDVGQGDVDVQAPRLHVAVIAYPRISNLDEFQPLRTAPGVRLTWARHPRDLQGVDWVILPGSKHTLADLAWLREQGLDLAVLQHARQGRQVLGICGGLQMLGQALEDPLGVAGGSSSSVPGLGLLPLVTRFESNKLLREVTCTFDQLGRSSRWGSLQGVSVRGYEIHQGRTHAAHEGSTSPALKPVLFDAQGAPLGWMAGSVLGIYLHGLFESPGATQRLIGQPIRSMDEIMDGLADHIDAAFDPGVLMRLLD